MNASNLTGIAYRKHMENLDKLGCYIFFIKKNGERYKKATWIDFVGSEVSVRLCVWLGRPLKFTPVCSWAKLSLHSARPMEKSARLLGLSAI